MSPCITNAIAFGSCKCKATMLLCQACQAFPARAIQTGNNGGVHGHIPITFELPNHSSILQHVDMLLIMLTCSWIMVQLPSYDFYSSLQHKLSCSLIVGVNAAKVELCDYLSKLQGYTHARPLVSDAIRMLGISLPAASRPWGAWGSPCCHQGRPESWKGASGQRQISQHCRLCTGCTNSNSDCCGKIATVATQWGEFERRYAAAVSFGQEFTHELAWLWRWRTSQYRWTNLQKHLVFIAGQYSIASCCTG